MLGVVAAALVGLGVAAARSGTPGCTVPAPEVVLPPQLRVIGEFDRPFDPGDPRALQDASIRAASALHSDLTGARAGTPVAIAADHPAQHDALVVPLVESGPDPSAPPRVAGLVAYLRDCTGRAWYHDTDDLLHTDPSLLPQRFPTVTAGSAAATLGTSGLRLVWRDSPFAPRWLDPRSGRTVAAGPPG
jgi:hypothetical protein